MVPFVFVPNLPNFNIVNAVKSPRLVGISPLNELIPIALYEFHGCATAQDNYIQRVKYLPKSRTVKLDKHPINGVIVPFKL